jgi:demethylmenaquinone methyltransferase / 2-methoxy-6-polyprenyl-1,4-benzoquinol methylase
VLEAEKENSVKMNLVDHKERDAKKVAQMFSNIAGRYDLLNHVLSLGLDLGWRKKVAQETGKVDCHRILDVCTGTGDMAIELCRFWKGNANIDGLDFSRELINAGRKKVEDAGLQDLITFREGNAEKLPYKDEQYEAVTITFGLRNINDRLKALMEFYRVTNPGGRFVCLEFSQPVNPVFSKAYFFYLTKFAPLISKLLGSDSAAYEYLGNTIKDFPPPNDLVKLIESAGWKGVSYNILSGGIVAIHTGFKP